MMIFSSMKTRGPLLGLLLGLLVTLGNSSTLVAGSLAKQGGRKGRIKNGYWQKRHKPEGWVIVNSANYQIQSQAGKDKGERLAKHMETMLKVYKKLFKPGKPRQGKKNVIKLFRDREAYWRYGAPRGTGGYYSMVAKEMVTYDTGKWLDKHAETPTTGKSLEEQLEKLRGRLKMDTLGVASHEGWHQYFHWYVVSWVPLPQWINEGMGDYFYTAMPKKTKSRRKIPAEMGRINQIRLPVIQYAIKAGKHVPVAKLIMYGRREYYGNASICYAEGWALCQFLLHNENKKYARIVPRYIKSFKKEKSWRHISKRVFKGIDLEKLDKDFTTWVMSATLNDPPGSPATKKKALASGDNKPKD